MGTRYGMGAADDGILDDPDQTVVAPACVDSDQTVIDPNWPGNGVPRVPTQAPLTPPAAPPRPAPTGSTALALPQGFRLHEYRIDRVLGQGGFGITYLATDVNLNSRVAIKEYLPEEIAFRTSGKTVSAHSTRHRERYQNGLDSFLIEGRTLATFRHPNIVRVARFFEAHQTAYMVLEYERGSPLKTWWPQHAKLGEKALSLLLQPLLDGLSVVHAAGFLHRDIKPDNIQVRRADGSLVLLDFGSARQAVGTSGQADIAVTPGYAPIEQYEDGHQGAWTDIYAFGATLYWLVTGKKPPDALDRQLLAAQGQDPLVPATQAGQGRYSPQFLGAIDWALQLDPTQRPQEIQSWRRALFAAHAASMGLQEALRAGDALHPHEVPGWAWVKSPRLWRGRAAKFLRGVVSPASWPLALKMTLAMVLTALMPMMITAYYNLHASLATVSASELQNLEQLARSTAGRLAQLIGDSQNQARAMGTDADFIDFLAHPVEARKPAIKAKVDALVRANQDIHLVMVMDTSGTAVVANDASVMGKNFKFREYFKTAMAGRPHVTGIVVGAVTGRASVFFAYPVFGEGRTVIGAVVLSLKATSLVSILNEEQEDTVRQPFLIDGDGILIYHPDARLLYSSLAALPPAKAAEIRADQRFARDHIDSLNMPELAHVMVGAHDLGHVRYQSTVSQGQEIAGFAPVKGHDWVVGVSESQALFEAPLQRLFMNLLWSVGLVGLLFTGLALLFARTIVRPIRALTKAAHALKQGDYDNASLSVKSNDEIGRLARTFNVLIDVLRQRERERVSGSRHH
ncbi:MAG: HAMP domain-containing protein [Rubrivivax sp.]|nr:MAG: HAMP domain-containing protein [Rubrivivax sp.]